MKYTKSSNNEFFTGLKSNVDNYFSSRKIYKYGNTLIAVKGAILLLFFFGSYANIFLFSASTAALVISYILIGISGVMIARTAEYNLPLF